MVRTKYATSRRRVAWLMFLPCFDVLCALSEYRPWQNEIYLFYTITRTFDHISWASITSKTFKQSCNPLNYRIIRKNFTNNNFKTNLYSRRNFRSQNIAACQSLLEKLICLCLTAIRRYSQKLFAKLCWPVALAGFWSCAPVTPLDDVNCASIL